MRVKKNFQDSGPGHLDQENSKKKAPTDDRGFSHQQGQR
jgi:hypothetical protein